MMRERDNEVNCEALRPNAIDRIGRLILVLHGHKLKLLLNADLANLYDAETKVLLQAVRRNPDRFPKDFRFQWTDRELSDLRLRFVTSSSGGRRYAPSVFTGQDVAMLSSVLNSPRAIAVNNHVRLRELIGSNKESAKRLDELEARIGNNSPPTTRPLPASWMPS